MKRAKRTPQHMIDRYGLEMGRAINLLGDAAQNAPAFSIDDEVVGQVIKAMTTAMVPELILALYQALEAYKEGTDQ